MRPRLTVAVPTYNRAGLLAECLESVLAQTYGDFDLVVIDNCSTDDTHEVVRSFKDPRLQLVVNDRNLGPAGNGRRCIELSTGQYAYYMHDDDVMEPENLARKVAMLDAFPSASFVFSAVRYIGPDGRLLFDGKPHPGERTDYVLPGHLFIERALLRQNFISCPSVMVRRQAIMSMGWLDSRFMFTADWDMWMRLAAIGDVAYLAEPLLRYRMHDSQDSSQYALKLDGMRLEAKSRRALLAKVAHRLTDPDRFLDAMQLQHASIAVDRAGGRRGAGDRAAAREFARLALWLAPRSLDSLRRKGHARLLFSPRRALADLARAAFQEESY